MLTKSRYSVWLEALGIDPSTRNLSHSNHICSAHFDPDDMSPTPSGKMVLNSTAVPKFNLGPNVEQRKRLMKRGIQIPKSVNIPIAPTFKQPCVEKSIDLKPHIKLEEPALEIQIPPSDQNDVKAPKRCRICWDEKLEDALVPMTNVWAGGSKKSIKDIILFCVPAVSIQDNNHICKTCLRNLKSTYNFINRCLATEEILVQQTTDVIQELNRPVKLENILEKSIEAGKDIQIIFVNPARGTEEIAKEDEEKLQDHTYFIRSKPKILKDVKIVSSPKEDLSQTQPDLTVDDDSNQSNNDTCPNDFCDNLTLEDDKLGNEENPNVSSSEEYHSGDAYPQELLNMLDFVPENVRCISINNDMSPDHQKGLIEEGVNILNMSSDGSKKKRIIYLTREFESCMRQCIKCHITFFSRNDFIDHKHMHKKEDFLRAITAKNEGKFTCDVCQAKFSFDGDFRKHYKTAHSNPCPHKCVKCLKRFRTYNDLKDHEEFFKDTDKCVVKCIKCDRNFASRRHLEIHLADVADAPCCNYLKCKVCFVKMSKEDFKAHCELHPNYVCPECGKSLVSSASLTAHRNNVHRAAKGMCHECGKIFKGASMLRHHIDTIHGGNTYMCDRCPRQFKSKVYLRKHMCKVHSGTEPQKNFTCETCGKAFKEKFGLTQHIELLHERAAKYVCPTCGEKFVRNDYLQRHIKRHDQYMRYSCSVCKTSFSSESRLHSHQAIGHDENGKPLDYRRTGNIIRRPNYKKSYPSAAHRVCKICHKILVNSQALRTHYKAHLKIREFWCEKCQLTLRTYSTYKNHLKRHENPNFEWSCNICHAYHSSRAELEIHTNKVHTNKKYKCKYCSMKFGRKHLLYNHETLKHPEEYARNESLFKILDAQKDETAPEGSRVNRSLKGVKLGGLEMDIDQMINKLMKSDGGDLGQENMDEENAEPQEEDFNILNEDYQMTEEEVACNILESQINQDV